MAKAKGLFARLKEEGEKLKSMDEELKRKSALFNNSQIHSLGLVKEEGEQLKSMDEELKIKFAVFINFLINLESIIFV